MLRVFTAVIVSHLYSSSSFILQSSPPNLASSTYDKRCSLTYIDKYTRMMQSHKKQKWWRTAHTNPIYWQMLHCSQQEQIVVSAKTQWGWKQRTPPPRPSVQTPGSLCVWPPVLLLQSWTRLPGQILYLGTNRRKNPAKILWWNIPVESL